MCRCRWQSDLSLECFRGVLSDKLMINYNKTEMLLPGTGQAHSLTHNATFQHAQYKAKKNAGQAKMFLSDAVSIRLLINIQENNFKNQPIATDNCYPL